MRTTQRKGDIAKAKAISTFTSYGYDVALLLTESARYDLLVDVGTEIVRVQAKYASNHEVDLRRIHSNSRGYVTKKYEADSFDWLYVYGADGKEYLIKKCIHGRATITVNDTMLIETQLR